MTMGSSGKCSYDGTIEHFSGVFVHDLICLYKHTFLVTQSADLRQLCKQFTTVKVLHISTRLLFSASGSAGIMLIAYS